jgi:DNA-binding GntR family transcriptional regulator
MGQFAPGEKIDQYQLAEQLNVSLVPVREALKVLAAEGFVSLVPRRGAYIMETSRDHMMQLYQTRIILESEAITYTIPLLTRKHFSKLHKFIDAMEKAGNEQDIQQFILLNNQFHLSLYEPLNNEVLSQMIMKLREKSKIYHYTFLTEKYDYAQINEEHRQIVTVCQKQNVHQSKSIVRTHIENIQTAILRQITLLDETK